MVMAALSNDLKPAIDAPPFDRPMVLLNDIVEVFTAPDFDIQPLRIFPPKQSQGSMARHMAVQRHFSRPSI
jgi:hypothetical protein